VDLPEISFRDMASFVHEAQRTIDARFEELEKEIYQSSARQVRATGIAELRSDIVLLQSVADPDPDVLGPDQKLAPLGYKNVSVKTSVVNT
jgi:hypothetical protein